MANDDSTAAAIAVGQKKADEILALRNAALVQRKAALARHPTKLVTVQTAGFLVAAGDSWFDYPFWDVLKKLEDKHGYNVESSANAGDPIESMANQGGQLEKFARGLDKVLALGETPKALLLSGGGNDIAGKEFGMLLNNATSSIGGWNNEIVDGVLNARIATAYQSMLTTINGLCQDRFTKVLPILVHGYDYPVPDGRGFWGGWPIFPGPWLDPGFQEKHFTDPPKKVVMMHHIINLFNDMLAELVEDPAFGNVHYINLRNTLSTNDDDYKVWWDNELHPTEKGFIKIAAKFAEVLNGLP
jgi:GDSL-like Lipase/Acylhydrolase family